MRSSLLPSLFSLLIAFPAAAVTMDWTFVGDAGNPCDGPAPGPSCFGSVGYGYNIATYEVTNAQYTAFLNAKAVSDPLSLYHPAMGNATSPEFGGIARSGFSGSYTYSAIAGRENMPVNWVSFFDALRFANWLNNGQGSADTESGAYTLLGGTETPSNGDTVTRNVGATIVLTSEDEWYKAAYYDAATTSYFPFPMGANSPVCSGPTASAGHANCNDAVGDVTPRGSYTGSASPFGTFDQGGNVFEWNESIFSSGVRGIRGGSFPDNMSDLSYATRGYSISDTGENFIGFRVVMVVPEPGTGLLVVAGLLGLAGWRRTRA